MHNTQYLTILFRNLAVFFLTGFMSLTMACGQAKPPSSPPAVALSLTAVQVQALSAGGQKRYAAAPGSFFAILKTVLEKDFMLILLVDKKHALPASYEPADLVSLNDYKPRISVNRQDLKLRKPAADALAALSDAARKDGIILDVSSAYRSFSYQSALFDRNVRELGQAQAERESARAGTSQHQLGLAVDFGSVTEAFGKSKAGIWLLEHAVAFGFSLSYPQGHESQTGYIFEPWHFRFIGIEAAGFVAEYFDGLQYRALEFLFAYGQDFRQKLNLPPVDSAWAKGTATSQEGTH